MSATSSMSANKGILFEDDPDTVIGSGAAVITLAEAWGGTKLLVEFCAALLLFA